MLLSHMWPQIHKVLLLVQFDWVIYSGVPRNFFGGVSTNSVEDRGQRELGSGGVAHYSGVLKAAVIWYKKFHFI